MIGSSVLDKPGSGFEGSGEGGEPPIFPRTAEGNFDDDKSFWRQLESDFDDEAIIFDELSVASAIYRHPSSEGADEVELTQALLNDGWRERHQAMKDRRKHVSFLGDNVVIFRDYDQGMFEADNLPPAA